MCSEHQGLKFKGDGAVEEMAIGVEKYQWLVLGLRLGSNGM